MNTLDMMAQAKIDSKTYQHDDETFYNVNTGFMNEVGTELRMTDIYSDTLNEIFNWAWAPVKTITRAEAEEQLGVKIVG